MMCVLLVLVSWLVIELIVLVGVWFDVFGWVFVKEKVVVLIGYECIVLLICVC